MNKDKCIFCAGLQGIIFLSVGCIIIIVSSIGYSITARDERMYESTTCEILEPYPNLATQSCTWCEEYDCCGTCTESCGAYNDNICTYQCCSTCCNYIPYICSGAQWNVRYNTLNETCPELMTALVPSVSKINWKKTRGSRATEESYNQALVEQTAWEFGSKHNCYYNHNKCNDVRFNVSDASAWFIALISGASIMTYGLLITLLGYCIFTNCVQGCRYALGRKSAVYREANLNYISTINMVPSPPYEQE